MRFLDICMCAGLVLFLPQCTQQVCTEGTPEQCADAEFAPGTNLAGEGFDITKMERKGAFVLNMDQWERKDKKCTLCTNPFVGSKQQKLPLSVVDWRPKQSCSMKVASKMHRSSESLVSSTTSSINNDWRSDLEVQYKEKKGSLMLAGTNSKLADYSMEKTKNDKYSFASQSMSCEYYSYRVNSKPLLHEDFQNAVKKLPKTYTTNYKKQFYKLIDKFGTHYITMVKLGGGVQSVTSIQQCQASLQGLSVEEVEMCLETEASASMANTVNFSTQAKHCRKDAERFENNGAFSSIFSDRFTEIKGGQTTEPDLLFSANKDPAAYKEWLTTLPTSPDIISYSLEPLHELLPTNDPSRKNLRSAISHYILERGLLRNCSGRCQAGIRSTQSDPCICSCHNDPAVTPDCCPSRRGMARVIITIQRATGLWGDHTSATDGYVKVLINKQQVQRSNVILNNNNPTWDMTVDLGAYHLSAANKVRFEVWDQDNNWNDDLLGACEPLLSAGTKEDVCVLQYGRLFYKWDVKCAPSLDGDSCRAYVPSPMSPSLRNWYVSRHAHPLPKALLLKMGVLVSETSSQNNHTL